MTELRIKNAALQGNLYPSDKLNLEREISLYLEAANTEKEVTQLQGIIVPYGDYRMVGGVMARSFVHLIGKKYKNVLLLSPSFHSGLQGIEIFDGDGIQTPLGTIPVDKKMSRDLASSIGKYASYSENYSMSEEAGLECPLPFLQNILGNFRISTLLIGNLLPEEVTEVSQHLYATLHEEKTLIVLSANLTVGKPYDEARTRDETLLAHVRESNLEGIFRQNEKEKLRDFNLSALALFMKTIHRFSHVNLDVLTYRNSTDVDGNRTQSSGYFAAIVY